MSGTQIPTLEQQVAKFKGFSTTDGEVSTGETTQEEKEVLAQRAAEAEARRKGPSLAEAQAQLAKTNGNAAALARQQTQQAAAAAEGDAGAGEGEGEDDDGTAGEGEGDGQQPAQQPNKPKKSVQERINAAVKRQRSAERALESERAARAADRDDFNRRFTDLEARIAGGGTRPQGSDLTQRRDATTVDGSVAPRPEDFEYGELDTRYIRALARHEAQQELVRARASSEAAQQTQAKAAADAEFATQRAAFEEAGTAKYDDFTEVVIDNAYDRRTNPGGYPLSETIGKLAFESEHGPAIVYALANDLKEARRVFGLSAAQQAAYFGRKEAALSSASSGANAEGKQQNQQTTNGQQSQQQPPAKTTQAPPPVKGARGAGARNPVDASTTDFAAFERLAMARK